MKKLTYKDAGVNVELGEICSQIMFEASRLTWNFRTDNPGNVISDQIHYGAVRHISVPMDPDLVFGLNSDGVGTKIELAERRNNHRTIAYDLFAMLCDDASINGAEPIVVSTVLDFNKLNSDIIIQIAEGMVPAAKVSNVCVINGEIAELGERVGGFGECNYNWSGTLLWAAKRSRLVSINPLRPGIKVIAVREDGIRSNGISLLRKIMSQKLGDSWHNTTEGEKIIEQALTPSQIYTPLLVKLNGGYRGIPAAQIYGAVHVTGGGIPNKFARLLHRSNLGSVLNNLFDPPKFINKLQQLGNVSDVECYKTWNMGQGLLILSDEVETVERTANSMGYETILAGILTDDRRILIKSKGLERKNELIEFPIY